MPTFDLRHALASAALGATLLCAGTANAHFILVAPPADLEQGPLGDPQKDQPCGQDGTGVETGMITAYQAGDTVTITINETIYHPGHFRIALAVNDPSELPPDPEVTPDNLSDCGSVEIMDPPVFPVLADGMLLHDAAFPDDQSIDVTLPSDVNCDACTLQVLMFMREHPAQCFYHHCATISISGGAADGSTSASGGDSDSSGGDESSDGGSASASATSPDSTASASASGSDSDGSATDDTATGATAATTVGVTDTASGGDDGGDDSGCGCSSDAGHPLATMLGLLGLLGLRHRRRAHG